MTSYKSILIICVFLLVATQGFVAAQSDWEPPRTADEWLTNPVRGAVFDMGEVDSNGEPAPSAEMFEQLAEAGANVVMIQVEYVWTMEAPFEPIEVQFELLKNALDDAAEAGLYIIVSVRNGPGTNTMISTDIDIEDAITDLYTDPEVTQAYGEMLQDLITRFGDREEIIAWEPLVEPNANRFLFDGEGPPYTQSAPAWNAVAKELIAAIREVDAERPILISPMDFASLSAFEYLEKFEDENIVYNIHFYDPFSFVFQIDEPYGTYPGTHYAEYVDKSTIASWFEPIEAFQAEHNVPIVIGEWGGVRWVPMMEDFSRDVVDLFEERSWSWLLYAWYDANWRQGGLEWQWGPERRNPVYDPMNPVLLPLYEAWQAD